MQQDEQLFTDLVKQHKSTIYSVCYMFSTDKDEVEDLFQEALINLWRGLPAFEGRSQVATWVWRVTLNTCISADRKKRRNATVPLTMDIDLFDQNNEQGAQAQMLRDRIQRLQPFDRAIVLLWLESMSYDEIAAIVGITPKNVGVRLYRIKEQLKQMSN
ncbi:MAG: sigma-70 family RNA polymerase sigma factor [Muribaculaceae bacterium]|jgi:RNA polymerase sigma-70 factor (ECF subfamily)|nr:sigma-70 family RNA polymerase sigma factor [Muribaculaceae bacterium]